MVLMFAGAIGASSFEANSDSPSSTVDSPAPAQQVRAVPTAAFKTIAGSAPVVSNTSDVVPAPASVQRPVVALASTATPATAPAATPATSPATAATPVLAAANLPALNPPPPVPMLPIPRFVEEHVAKVAEQKQEPEQPAIVVAKAPSIAAPVVTSAPVPVKAVQVAATPTAAVTAAVPAATQSTQAVNPAVTVAPVRAVSTPAPSGVQKIAAAKKKHKLHLLISADSTEASAGDDADAPANTRVVTVNVNNDTPKAAARQPDAPLATAKPVDTGAINKSDFSEIKANASNQFLTYAPPTKDAALKEGPYTPTLVDAAPGGLAAWVKVSPKRTIAVKKGDDVPGYGKVESITPTGVVTEKGTINLIKE